MGRDRAVSKAREIDSDIPTDPTVSVVAPAYNEAKNLTPLVGDITDVLDEEPEEYEIVLVDDGSTDNTNDTIRHLSELFDQVRGITLSRNFGQSAALAAGIDAARGDEVVTIDADQQNDPSDIPALLDELRNGNDGDGYDCVSGRRADRQDPLAKRVPSNVQTYLAKFTGPDVNDFGCTLKAYRADALRDINLYGEGHRYIPAMLYGKGYETAELDVNHRPREHGSSHYGAGRLVRGFVDLCFQWFWNRYGSRPLHFFGLAGFVMIALGASIGALTTIQKFVFGVSLLPRTPRLILVSVLLLFGLQLLVFGVLAEMLTKLNYRDERPYRVREIME